MMLYKCCTLELIQQKNLFFCWMFWIHAIFFFLYFGQFIPVVSWSEFLFIFISFCLFMLLNDQILLITVLTCNLTTFLWPNNNQKSKIILLNYYDLLKNIKHKTRKESKMEIIKGIQASWRQLMSKPNHTYTHKGQFFAQ